MNLDLFNLCYWIVNFKEQCFVLFWTSGWFHGVLILYVDVNQIISSHSKIFIRQ